LDDYSLGSKYGLGLISIKVEEIQEFSVERLVQEVRSRVFKYDLLLHGLSGSSLERELCSGARKIFAASREIASRLEAVFPEVIAVFAPGAPVHPQKDAVDCTLLTFGMAHKIRSEGYRRLASLLEKDPRTFRLEISTALHEGGTFDESFFTVSEEISAVFSGKVRFLGFLTDAEVSERLRSVDALVAFFPNGVRENNTTVLSAMSHGCPVVSNLDDFSPVWMSHNKTILDISKLDQFPQKTELHEIGASGQKAAAAFTFDRLAAILLSEDR
jgi:hypothetical protein